MQHLSTDRLAALGDDEPTPLEAAHLDLCEPCARERAAYRALAAMARAEREPLGLPLTRWESIAGALASGDVPDRSVVAPPPAGAGFVVPIRSRRLTWARLPLRIAAGLLLVVSGVMAGRASTGAPMLPLPGAGAGAATSASGAAAVEGTDVGALIQASSGADSAVFGSVEAAREAQLRSEALYQQAAAYLARHDTSGAGDGSPVAYRSRLAALDQVIETTREAMRQAPHDPVINGYYLTTLGQREATIRQLNTVLPVSLRANSY